MGSLAIQLLGSALLAVLVVLLTLYLMQDSLVFPGQSTRGWLPEPYPEGAAQVWAQGQAGPLHGVYLDGPADWPLALVFGGNAACVASTLPELEHLASHGLRVLMYDYPGYGGSSGRPSAKALLEMADIAFEEARTLADGAGIILVGRSIGSAPAAYLGADEDVEGVVIIGGFTSLADAAQAAYGWLPVRAFVRHDLDNLGWISAVRAPVLVLHNRDDEILPVEMASRLADAAGRRSTLAIGESGGHNGLSLAPDEPGGRALASFLASNGLGQRVPAP